MFLHFSSSGGDLLAAGMTYQAVFAIFAGLWVAFAVAGFLITANPELQAAFFAGVNRSVPGLIGPNGAIPPGRLLSAGVFGWTGAIALIGLLITALGFLAAARDSIRRIFALPGDTTFFLLVKLKDLGLAVAFGAVVLLSAILSVGSTAALDAAYTLLGIDSRSAAAIVLGRTVGLLIALALDVLILAAAYRILSGVPIPRRRLLAGALLGAVALGILKALGSALLGGASTNPLLASFAVIIGLLIWFNLICRVILLAASWIAVGMSDAGVSVLAPEPPPQLNASAN